MKWKGRAGSRNVEDRRGSGGFGMGGKGILGGGLGIVFIIVFMLLGGDPGQIINQSQIITQGGNAPYQQTAEEEELAEFASVVLADTEAVWQDIFYEYGEVYQEPILVLYSGYVQSACGTAGSSTGPFYCPGDNKVYIDLSFFQEMETRFDAPGDFAMA